MNLGRHSELDPGESWAAGSVGRDAAPTPHVRASFISGLGQPRQSRAGLRMGPRMGPQWALRRRGTRMNAGSAAGWEVMIDHM
jgi:hypothetical protein